MKRTRRASRGAAAWVTLLFLLVFVALLLVAVVYYLVPAARAMAAATRPQDKHLLRGVSMLVLAVVLFCLLGGLVLTFRIGRFFIPKPPRKKTKTEYSDIWEESGRRLQPPEEEESE